MTVNTKNIIGKIFQADSLDKVSLRLLEELIEQNPSFGLGHFLLSQKLKQEHDPLFPEQVQRTGLYFTNPFWLQWLLKNEGEEKESRMPEKTPFEPLPLPEHPLIQPVESPGEDKTTTAINGNVYTEEAAPVSTEIKEETPVFEPYHTIDYFASQGIKYAQDQHPQDRLGKQLKSFTEWLKMMKRLPQKTTETILDEKTRDIIQTDAAQSLLTKEVLTETMAEVLIKQGRTEEAAEVYRKLSLHNPGKSVYFAAKIEQLKVN